MVAIACIATKHKLFNHIHQVAPIRTSYNTQFSETTRFFSLTQNGILTGLDIFASLTVTHTNKTQTDRQTDRCTDATSRGMCRNSWHLALLACWQCGLLNKWQLNLIKMIIVCIRLHPSAALWWATFNMPYCNNKPRRQMIRHFEHWPCRGCLCLAIIQNMTVTLFIVCCTKTSTKQTI